MRKHRSLFIALLALLLLVGIPTGFLVREYRREQAGRDLIAAIKANDTPAALAALRNGADPNTREYFDEEPLTFSEHMKQLFDRLLHPRVKNNPDDRRTALLLYLVVGKQDNPALVKALLDAGADVNLTGETYSVSPLMWAADGNHVQTLRLLLQRGGNVHQQDVDGWTTLHWACRHGSVQSITLLLDAGADINAQNHKGQTPLYTACWFHHPPAVQTLLQHHADPNIRDKDGETPLDWALSDNKNTQLVELLRKAAGTRLLHK